MLLSKAMKVIIPKGSGFCPGVLAAEKKLFEIRKNYDGKIYISGMFIHNKEYEKYLIKNNIISCKDYESIEDGSIFVISTHGLDKDIEKKLRNRLKVFDLTCPKVKNVQNIISTHQNYLTVITGKEEHPEVLGLKSYSKKNLLISNVNKLSSNEFLEKIKDQNLILISQTTANLNLFEETYKVLYSLKEKKFIKELLSFNTICPSIANREKNAIEILTKFNLNAIVIGDKLSSNSLRLFSKLKEVNNKIFFIENKEDLNNIMDEIKEEKEIMVVSSSSTPSFIEKEIIEILSNV